MRRQQRYLRRLAMAMGLASAAFLVTASDAHYTITADGNGQGIADVVPAEVATLLEPFHGDLDQIRERRLLRVLVTHSRTDFFIDQGRIRGAQAEILRELMKHLNKGHRRESSKIFLQYIPVPFDELIPALARGEADIAAAFLTVTDERRETVDFASGQGRETAEILVANKTAAPVNAIGELAGKTVHILKGSSYESHLADLNVLLAKAELPAVDIVPVDRHLLTEDILELVNAGVIDYTFCDEFKAGLWRQVFPNIRVQADVRLTEPGRVSWAVRKDTPVLQAELEKFSRKVRKGTLLGNVLFRRYFEDTHWIDNPGGSKERERFEASIALFNKYADRYDFDPLALVAQAYQESKLNHQLKSHRGAVGIMQLLPSTARDPNVNIPDIEDLENNIHAGARYLRFLHERYFSDPAISPWDQRLFTWAAYNAGPANIIRIRNAARRNNLDANVWFGNVEVMAARMISREPVRYVANIHKYYVAYKLIATRSDHRTEALKALELQ